MSEINKLPEQVVNQIAAGEVVERPASVLKELIENAIDSAADSVEVFVEQGGIRKIEVRDNGKGILKDDLHSVFERHATSKIRDIKDLDTILSYGFRGEALASISAVSTTKILSARDNEAYSIVTRDGKMEDVVPASRGQGTTVTVQNIFESLPARQKFLKKEQTEYRYILEVFQYFALLNGDIHFRLVHNNKDIYNLPKTSKKLFPIDRVATIFKLDKDSLVEVSHKEYGIEVSGVIIHPKLLGSRSKMLLQYVNSRPVQDKGITRAMQQGISEFVPDFYKVSGILGVFLPSDQVDVNVHPRKMEVKFLNPYRIFSAVTHAVKSSVLATVNNENLGAIFPSVQASSQSEISSSSNTDKSSPAFGSGQSSFSNTWNKKENNAYDRLRPNQPMFFGDSVENQYSGDSITTETNENLIPKYELERILDELDSYQIIHALNRYIIAILSDEIWMIDQHAAAERIRYEQFKNAYQDNKSVESQQLLAPIAIPLSEQELHVLKDRRSILNKLGFEFKLSNDRANFNLIPVAIQKGDIELLIRDTIAQMMDQVDVFDQPVLSDFVSEKDMSMVIATMACHNSVRMNQKLSAPEVKGIIKDLLRCKVPYACPHGRRVIWRLKQEYIDKQFMRP